MPRAKRMDLKEPLLRFINENLDEEQPRRLHICSAPIGKFITRRQQIDMKPSGLWYGFNDSWIQWCIGEETGWLQPLIYEVELHLDSVLRITTIEEFEAFEAEYAGLPAHMRILREAHPDLFGPTLCGRRFIDHIDYSRLAARYGALEITPYLWAKRLDSMWYYGWDCESGCVWSKKAIKELRLIAEFDETSGEYHLT